MWYVIFTSWSEWVTSRFDSRDIRYESSRGLYCFTDAALLFVVHILPEIATISNSNILYVVTVYSRDEIRVVREFCAAGLCNPFDSVYFCERYGPNGFYGYYF